MGTNGCVVKMILILYCSVKEDLPQKREAGLLELKSIFLVQGDKDERAPPQV
jgi:hypothetical protein